MVDNGNNYIGRWTDWRVTFKFCFVNILYVYMNFKTRSDSYRIPRMNAASFS